MLGEDIKQPIILWREAPDTETMLLDGRNRLDAMELVGLPTVGDDGKLILDNRVFEETIDPRFYVSSANIHRRHLTVGQRRQAIAKLIAVNPSRSDRVIAKDARVDAKTIAAIRKECEDVGSIPHVEPTNRIGANERNSARKTINKSAKAEPSSPSPPERSLAAQLAACPEWRMLTNPTTVEEMSLEYHSVIATLSKIHEPIERRLIERWINTHWQPDAAVAAD